MGFTYGISGCLPCEFLSSVRDFCCDERWRKIAMGEVFDEVFSGFSCVCERLEMVGKREW